MGRRNSTSLTKRVVDASLPAERRYHVWDRDLAGFGLRVEPTGTKTFITKYRANGGGRKSAQRIVTLGRYGALTPEEARRQAKTILGSVATGSDPAGDLKSKRREMTIAELIEYYEKHGCVIQRGKRIGEPMKPLTKTYTIARLRHHVLPLLGHRKVTEISAGDIERFAADVQAGRTAKNEKTGVRKRIIVRGGPGASRKVVRDLSAVFSFARRSNIVESNPCEKAAVRKTDGRKTRFLTLEEVCKLGKALDELETEGTNPKAIAIAKLWALTGCRRNEIASLKWSEVDMKNGLLMFENSKTGLSVRPLGTAAIAALQNINRNADSEYVFPADIGDGFFQGTKTPWARAIKKANLVGVTPHTLRHTIGSTAISTGEDMALTGAILGHANQRSTAIYAHVQNTPSRLAANRVSSKIASALGGTTGDEIKVAETKFSDEYLLKQAAKTLDAGGPSAVRIRKIMTELLDQIDLPDSQMG